ncbi:MAG: helix-hairpin-helix domain-containing protein [Bacteroidetes bacterium]|nr:helix-hairpin-helix domain-containing protein [Bacteroidota bacterium]
MIPHLPFRIRRRQYWSIFILAAVFLCTKVIFLLLPPQRTTPQFTHSWVKVESKRNIKLVPFDPNSLNAKQWQELGFSIKQSATILKYKEIVGGAFQSKAQLKKCYAISNDEFETLSPYLLLPERKEIKSSFTNYKGNEITISQKFNPDKYTQRDWQKLGFSEKQAAAILKYKNYLGGSFVSKEKLKECFIISDENYAKIAPYLILPEKTPASFHSKFTTHFDKNKTQTYPVFDPNQLDEEGWKNLGFSEKQAEVIVHYRDRNLRGQFRSLEDLKKCFVISEKKYNELLPYIQLTVKDAPKESSNSPHATIAKTQEKPTDFSTVDLNKINFKQLVEYGFTEKDAAMILGFRKKLGGFVQKQQLVDTYEIDKNLGEKLMNEAQLNTESVLKYSLTEAPEEWLKSHPYFKYSAEKIIYFRISNPEDKKILKFLKLKPEYESRMKLYMKEQ